MRTSFALALLAAAIAVSAPAPKADPNVRVDDFDGKFALDWKVIRPDAESVSLKKTPGSLVITTGIGSIHGKEAEGTRARNIHLVEIPFPKDTDWQATTVVSGFKIATHWHQAGLIVYGDDDNYVKWTYEHNWRAGGGETFHLVAETDGEPVHDQPEKSESGLTRFHLRLTKRGGEYEYAWSKDGKDWTSAGSKKWGDGNPKRVGLIAKNGGNPAAANIDAAFESFELKALPTR